MSGICQVKHRILKQMPQFLLLEFCHTGDVESVNALLLKYAKKTHIYRSTLILNINITQIVFSFQLAWNADEVHSCSH